MKHRKILSLLLAAVMVLTLMAGCSDNNASNSETPADSSEPTVLRMAVQTDPSSLAPYGSGGPRTVPCDLLYEYLAKMDSEGNLENWMAKEIINNGNGVYDIEIYDYITDSAGNKFTASDVVFSFNMFIEDGRQASYVAGLESVEAIDDTHVRITMSHEAPGGTASMLSNVRMITEKAWNDSPDEMITTPVGTSHYVLSSYTAGSEIVYTRREDYWQQDESLQHSYAHGNIDTVKVVVITDTATQAMALESGEIDVSSYLAFADLGNFVDIGTLEALPGYTAQYDYNTLFYHLVFNCKEGTILDDINLRRAIAYCFSREEVASVYWGATGVPCKADIIPVFHDYDEEYVESIQPYYGPDVETAKDYLAQSNYDGTTPIRFLVNDTLGLKDAATLICARMNEIGIKTELMAFDNALYSEYKNDNTGEKYDIELCGDSNNCGYAYQSWKCFDNNSYSNGINHCQVNDPKLQELYDAVANVETCGYDAANALMQYVYDQCYVVALYGRLKTTVALENIEIVTSDIGNVIAGSCSIH